MVHVIKQGEHLSTLAHKYGFRDYRTIWDDPHNAELKTKRKNPNVLYPGDEVFIPDKKQSTKPAAAGDVHTFQVTTQKLRLRVVVRDVNAKPMPNSKCQVEIDGKTTELVTGADGKIDREIPVPAHEGRLLIANREYRLLIGDLDPVDTISGQRARLANLGYYLGGESEVNEEELQSAIEEFQCDYDLTVDGICGPVTQAKLLKVYGC